MNSDPAKRAWLSSVEIGGALPLDDVRKGADKFYRLVKWRNRIEYAACAFAIVVFTVYIFTLPMLTQKIGSAMVVVGTIYAGWQLHRRASAEAPEKAGTMPIWVFARGQLVRHRDALRGIFWWYILPFIPGLAVMIIGNGFDPAMNAKVPIWLRWAVLGGIVAFLAGIWWLNQWAANKLQRRIDEIDALTGEQA